MEKMINIKAKRWVKWVLPFYLITFLPLTLAAQSDRQLIRQGNKQFRAGNMAEAEVLYRKAVEKNQRNPQATYNLGNALMEQRKDSLSINQLEASAKLETNPLRRAQAFHNIGVICQKHQMFNEAIEAYKESLRNNPTDDQTRYNLELCKRQQKQQQQDDKQNQQKQEQEKKEQEQKQEQEKQEKKDQQQPPKQQMSKDNAEQLLNAAMQEEKQTQERMQKAMQRSQKRTLEKNW
jgi:Ca-activated chloride channel family protein